MDPKDLIDKYVKLRDKVAEIKKEAEEKTKPLAALMARIEGALADAIGTSDSVKTEHGTAFFKEVTSATVADWDTVLQWIMESPDRAHFFERRINKTAVEDFIKESDGDLPPGVNYKAARVVQVRRS